MFSLGLCENMLVTVSMQFYAKVSKRYCKRLYISTKLNGHMILLNFCHYKYLIRIPESNLFSGLSNVINGFTQD